MPTATATPPRKAATRETPREAKSVFPMTGLKLEEPQPDGRVRIEGYAAVFGNRDAYGDIIMPGAFGDSLERREVKVLWQHASMHAIGLQESAVEDEFGLAVVGALTNTELVTGTVVPLLRDGVISGLSIGYNVLEEDYDGDLKAWLLKEIELFEWSPVTFPANELATIATVKDLGGRGSQHVASVERHAKTLIHLLGEDGYFAKSDRREALDSDQLEQLRDLLVGALPGEGAASSVNEKLIEMAYTRGANDALDFIDSTTPEEGT